MVTDFIRWIGKARFHTVLRLRRLLGLQPVFDWDARAKKLGRLAVIDDSIHTNGDFDSVSELQKAFFEESLPTLSFQSRNREKGKGLDFGCGIGRFTSFLVDFYDAEFIGYDPVKSFIAQCEPTSSVSFTSSWEECEHENFSIIFVCMVFGGLKSREVSDWFATFHRVLSDDGVVVVCEAIGQTDEFLVWRPRTLEVYQAMAQGFEVTERGVYFDGLSKITMLECKKMVG